MKKYFINMLSKDPKTLMALEQLLQHVDFTQKSVFCTISWDGVGEEALEFRILDHSALPPEKLIGAPMGFMSFIFDVGALLDLNDNFMLHGDDHIQMIRTLTNDAIN